MTTQTKQKDVDTAADAKAFDFNIELGKWVAAEQAAAASAAETGDFDLLSDAYKQIQQTREEFAVVTDAFAPLAQQQPGTIDDGRHESSRELRSRRNAANCEKVSKLTRKMEERIDSFEEALAPLTQILESTETMKAQADVVETDKLRKSIGSALERSEQLKASKNQTAATIAFSSGNAEMVQMLLKKGADINTRNAEGRTALQRAVTPAYNAAAEKPAQSATKAPSPEKIFAAQVNNGMGSEVLAAVAGGMKPTPQQIDEAVRKALDLKPIDTTKINVDSVIERFCTVAALLTAGVAPLRTTITYAEEMKNPHLAQQLATARRQYLPAF